MDTKKIPPIITLTAALVASIVTFLFHYELKDALVIILCVIVGFYIFSCMIKFLFDKMGMSAEAMAEKQKEEEKLKEEQKALEEISLDPQRESQDGSVIEKDT
jgi:uncharacterized membrane protein (DUF106 family)